MTQNTLENLPVLHIPIQDINNQPGPCCMSFHFNIKPLVRSIRDVGLINIPLLKENANPPHDVVLGFRRIKAMEALGMEELPCRMISESELSPLDGLLLNLNDNLASRTFNEVEKAMVISRLSRRLEPATILETYMPLLGLPSKEHTRILYCRLENELDEQTKGAMVTGQVSLHAVRLILDMEDEAKDRVFRLIEQLMFNVNQQKQLIEYLTDICHIENKTIPDILSEQSLQEICADTHMNNPQKVKLILKKLRSRIFPRLITAEKAFNKTASTLDLPAGVRISAAPFFEAPDYRMEILFKNGKALNEKLRHLSKTKGLENLVDPWEKDLNG